MPFWYNSPNKDSKFSSLACSDWSSLNSRLDFKEFAIKEDDTFYWLFGFANNVTDVVFVKGGRDWKFEPQLVTLKIAKKDYDKWDSNEKKTVPVLRTKFEAFWCRVFEDLDKEKVYSGRLTFQDIPQLEMVLSGIAYGEPMTEQTRRTTVLSMCQVIAVEVPEIIKPEELTLPVKGLWNKPSGQSEYERLGDRFRFTCEQLKVVFPNKEINSIADISNLGSNEKESVDFTAAFQIILAILGSR